MIFCLTSLKLLPKNEMNVAVVTTTRAYKLNETTNLGFSHNKVTVLSKPSSQIESSTILRQSIVNPLNDHELFTLRFSLSICCFSSFIWYTLNVAWVVPWSLKFHLKPCDASSLLYAWEKCCGKRKHVIKGVKYSRNNDSWSEGKTKSIRKEKTISVQENSEAQFSRRSWFLFWEKATNRMKEK